MSRDTWEGNYHKPLSLDRWTYVKGDPINQTDPSGLCAQPGWQDAQGLFTEANCDALEADLANRTTDFTEAWYRQLAVRERADGLKQAANNLEYYLNGAGGEYHVPASFVKNTITVAMPEINNRINDLAKWYIQKQFEKLSDCQAIDVGPDTYAWLLNTPNYYLIGLGWLDRQKEVAASVGTFRIDVELSGTLNKNNTFLSLYNIDSELKVKVTMFDVYNWNPGDGVYYPPDNNRNWILDDWAANLERHGNAKSFIVRGDYTYTANLNNVGRPGFFFDANSPPDKWVLTSCTGSQFDVDAEGPGTIDYCGKPMR